MKKIAVDVEGVLADSYQFARGNIPKEEMESWGFTSEEMKEEFLDVLTDGWNNKWRELNTVTPSSAHAVQILNEIYSVDIVTARTNADEEIIQWLDYNNIPYQGFVSTKTYKERLGYDIYIDDNPHMVGKDINLYLHDQPWNQHVDAENRVSSVVEATAEIIINDSDTR